MAKHPEVVLTISDLHCGSTVGLLPPDCHLTDESGLRYVPQRPYQKWLWMCWQDMKAEVFKIMGDSPFSVVINGDCVEGVHHGGSQLVSTDTKNHSEIAAMCLVPITSKAEKVYIVRGTECHTKTDEHVLGKVLGAVSNPITGLFTWDHLALKINGCNCSWRHHISVACRVYLEAGALSAHLANEQLECLRAGWTVPNVIFRAHRHRHGEYSDGTAMAVVSAAWQGETRHVHKVAVASISRPSWVIADWRGKESGELPSIHRRVYCPPNGGSA